MSAATSAETPSSRMILRHWPSAWTWLCTTSSSSSARARHAKQLMVHRQEVLADDRELGGRQQMMDIGDPAREDSRSGSWRDPPRPTIPHESSPRRSAAAPARNREDLQAGDVGVRPRLALEHNALSRQDSSPAHLPASSLRARSRSAGVSTPNGTSSMIVTSMRMPASSARNCSSFSRFSSVLGGSFTKRSSAARR